MKNLNEDNGAAPILLKYAEIIRDRFTEPIGAELGIAYGGGVESIGKLWKIYDTANRAEGNIFGFDTFAGHPRSLSYSDKAHEAWCMEHQYKLYGTEGLSYEYQRSELDRQELTNVTLVKGLINENSFKNAGINRLHYCLLDMDMINPMALGLTLALPVMQKGGFLCLHDAVPRGHIFGLWGLYQEVMASGEYKVVEEVPQSYLVVMEKL